MQVARYLETKLSLLYYTIYSKKNHRHMTDVHLSTFHSIYDLSIRYGGPCFSTICVICDKPARCGPNMAFFCRVFDVINIYKVYAVVSTFSLISCK